MKNKTTVTPERAAQVAQFDALQNYWKLLRGAGLRYDFEIMPGYQNGAMILKYDGLKFATAKEVWEYVLACRAVTDIRAIVTGHITDSMRRGNSNFNYAVRTNDGRAVEWFRSKVAAMLRRNQINEGSK